MAAYLDCNATTPIEPRVFELVTHYLRDEYGNAGSRTHDYGARAQKAVQKARDQLAAVVAAARLDVIFTSGATEANNIAILGLADFGEATGRKHIISTAIEHKAVLEPLEQLASRGFEISLVAPNTAGRIEVSDVADLLRPDTLLVTVMHVNNETGVIQPLTEICEMLVEHPAFLHTDAAQGFGKEIAALKNQRLDFISVSGHKIYGPNGIGSLIMRARDFQKPPIKPIAWGGGQERGLRPGTLPVHLIAGLGLAAELAEQEADSRAVKNAAFRDRLLEALKPLSPTIHGDVKNTLSSTLNLSFGTLDSEALMLGLKELVAISNGSACTSASYEVSHVLQAMGLDADQAQAATRWSWCHMTEEPDWAGIQFAIKNML